MTRFRPQLLILAIVAVAVAVITATSGGKTTKSARPVSPAAAISVRQTPVGRVLADANGRTLYLFAGDTRNTSRLSTAGRAVWPPFTSTTTPAATGGALASEIGTIPARGGTRQVTYDGHPLYYYVGDHTAGLATGQGLDEFGALWYVVSPAGRAIRSASRSTAYGGSASSHRGTAGGGSAGSYGY